jgi:hypothetical protein
MVKNWSLFSKSHTKLMLAIAIYQGRQGGLKLYNIDGYGSLDNHR